MDNKHTPTKPKATLNQLFASFMYGAAGVATIWMVVGHISDLAPMDNYWYFGLPMATAVAFIICRHLVPAVFSLMIAAVGVVGIALTAAVAFVCVLLHGLFTAPFKAAGAKKRKQYVAA